MLTEAQTRGLLDIMVGTSHRKRDNLGAIYLGLAGDELPRYLAEYFEKERRAEVREDLLRFAGPAATSDARAVALAARALSDPSVKVREVACWTLARSGTPAALVTVREWQPRTARDAENRTRCLRALERADIQEWVRDTPYDTVLPWRFSTHEPGSPEFDEEVEFYVRRVAPDLVPALERVLGDLLLTP